MKFAHLVQNVLSLRKIPFVDLAVKGISSVVFMKGVSTYAKYIPMGINLGYWTDR